MAGGTKLTGHGRREPDEEGSKGGRCGGAPSAAAGSGVGELPLPLRARVEELDRVVVGRATVGGAPAAVVGARAWGA
jgi:hypothetical protein